MRLKYVVKNSFFNIISQIVLIIVGFFSQRVLNLRIGEELVGMNSVISNILSLLSVSELGISSAIIFHLYRALAEQKEEQIAGLMTLYRKAYGIFATFISVAGLFILPFVHLFLNENSFSLRYVRVIYVIWLARTALSYLLSYKRSLLIADQREYIVSILVLFANVVNHSTVIVLLQFTKNYPLVLLLNMVVDVAINVWISCYVDKKYPYVKKLAKQPVDKTIFQKIMGDIKNIFVTRICAKLLLSTDSIIISSFVSVVKVGLYSNYCLITQSVINVMLALTSGLKPSVGNMFVEGNQKKNYDVLRQITFIYFLIISICCACLMALLTPFVADFWLTDKYALSLPIVTLCVVNFCLITMGFPLEIVIGATGLFKKERNVAVVVAIVNLAVSLSLVKPMGILGVQIGTALSYIVQICYRGYIFFKDYLKLNILHYANEMFQYVLLTIVETVAVYCMVTRFYEAGVWILFIVAGVVSVTLPLVINLLIYCRSWRLRSVINMFFELAGGKKHE